MQHFVKNVKPSIDRPVLVTLDNHNFHLDIRVLDYCRDNHVILFPFPPHCSHKLQPLELGIFASLKRYLREEKTEWVKRNPGKVMSIYDLSSLIWNALPKAASPGQIISGFEVSGIFPFKPKNFTELDNAPSTAALLAVRTKPTPDISESLQVEGQQCYACDMPSLVANLPSEITPGRSEIPQYCEFSGLVYNNWSFTSISGNNVLPTQELTPTHAAQNALNLYVLPPSPYFVFDPESMFPSIH